VTAREVLDAANEAEPGERMHGYAPRVVGEASEGV
jgi:hypothetical protein